MKKRSLKRIIGGGLFIIAFLAFAYISCKVAVHSSDLENVEPILINKAYGYDRNRYLINHGRADEIVYDEDYPDPEAETMADMADVYAEPMEQAVPELSFEPAPEPSAEPSPAELKAAALGLPAPPDIDITELQYVLVNGDHPMEPIDYEPANLVYLNMLADDTEMRTAYDGNRVPVDALIAQPLLDMARACKNTGLPVYLSSGYRSYAEQAANFQRVNANNGISDGKNAEGNYITMPAGCSEHQTGLGIDITDYYREIKNDSIAETATVQWLAENCADYGFILRFPQDKRDITHVMSESWHFRYVGKEAARYMMDNNLCLEEFVELYT